MIINTRFFKEISLDIDLASTSFLTEINADSGN